MKIIAALVLTFSISIASAINLGFSTSVTTLAVADVRQPILSSLVNSSDFIIQNPAANVVSIFVGGSDVTTSGATQGIEITQGSTLALFSAEGLTSSKIFIISTGTSIPVVIGRIVK